MEAKNKSVVPRSQLKSVKEYKRQWYLKNQCRLKESRKKRYRENREAEIQQSKNWSKNNPRRIKEIEKKSRLKNIDKRRAGKKEYHQRKKSDPIYRAKRNLRIRLCDILSGRQTSTSISKMLGCTTEELKHHLENQFTNGMSWDNYGRTGWHIDHIIELREAFAGGVVNEELLAKICHYTNLRPLWAKDNLARNRKR